MARKTVTDDFKIFSERLSVLMKERNVTQEELAQELGIKRQTVSLYKNGQSTPDAALLKDIAIYFNVSADWLLGLSDVCPLAYNEETPASLGLSTDFIRNLVFQRMNCFNGESEFFNSILGSRHFFDATKAIVRLCNIPYPDSAGPQGIEGCKLIQKMGDIGDQIVEESYGQYTVCRIDDVVDGLIFKAQSSFASAIEECYLIRNKKNKKAVPGATNTRDDQKEQ